VSAGDSSLVRVSARELADVRHRAETAARGGAKMLLHGNDTENVQHMVQCYRLDSYMAPHRQLNCKKSYQIVEGELSVPFFSNEGNLEEMVEMGDHQSGKVFLLHFPADRWHTVLPRSNLVIYVEVIPGPYRAENTQLAPWAPPNEDVAGGLAFLAGLSASGTGHHRPPD
jgi:cupin fold WbuC family metalloprotein